MTDKALATGIVCIVLFVLLLIVSGVMDALSLIGVV